MRLLIAIISLLITGTSVSNPNQVGQATKPVERLGLFIQQGQQRQLRSMIAGLEDYATARNIEFALIEVAEALPLELTATPAVVYQNEQGRAIYPGKHLDLAAAQLFVDGNRLQIRPSVTDERNSVLYRQDGRATTILSLKLTPWASEEGAVLPAVESWEKEVQEQLQSGSSFQRLGDVALQPTDRRYYLDIHPYRAADGSDYLSYAVFSQFNCHEPIFTNFGRPLSSLEELVAQVETQLKPYLDEPARGFSPQALPTLAPQEWSAIGWGLPEQSNQPEKTAATTDLVLLPPSLSRIRSLGFGLPQVQFNFPPPLDRYAGTVDGLEGELRWNQDQQQLSGSFAVDMRSLAMGSDALDEYVRKEALRTRRFRSAQVRFGPVALPEAWRIGMIQNLQIPAVLELMGVEVSMPLEAELTPQYDDAGQLQIRISTRSEIRIDQPFDLVGPDGPADLKNKVELRTQFLLAQ